MKTAVVVPTYNEKENIRPLVEAIFSLTVPDLEIIFVDDNSPDGTAWEIKNLANRYPLRLIERPRKLGLGSAYVAGFQRALAEGADFIFEMDADFSHQPKDIPRLLAACQNGAGLAIGSRKIPGGKIIGWNIWRRLMSDGAMLFARLILRLKTKDITAGFRCWRKKILEEINISTLFSDGYAFQEETLFRAERAGAEIFELPVKFVDRIEGKSKLSGKDILEFFLMTMKIRLSPDFAAGLAGAQKIRSGWMVVVGFLLSPLSWWNDIFINLPLAWLLAWLPLRFLRAFFPISRAVFIAAFVAGYWLTNLAGFILMHYGLQNKKNRLAADFLIALIYSAVIIALFLSDPSNILRGWKIIPSWVV